MTAAVIKCRPPPNAIHPCHQMPSPGQLFLRVFFFIDLFQRLIVSPRVSAPQKPACVPWVPGLLVSRMNWAEGYGGGHPAEGRERRWGGLRGAPLGVFQWPFW